MNAVLSKTIISKFIILLLVLFYQQNGMAQPAADFSATPVTGCAPLLVNFFDLSADNPTSWKWDLGNGTISTLQNPSVTYFTPGKYSIKLIAINPGGSDTIIKDEYITVEFNPTADFIADPVAGCLPLTVQFTDQSIMESDSISSWKWDFGDGFPDSVQNPNHTYTLAGTFDVTLQVKNTLGCGGVVLKSKIINTGNSVVANFSNNLQSTCKPPVNLNFQNLSTGPPTKNYQWDFGDGITSTQINPSHTYSTAGNFTVKLIASGGGCADTIQKQIVIGTVTADFISPVAVCEGKLFSITNASSSGTASASWNFGDGTISDSLNPIKKYNTSGSYIIEMIADFGACLDSVSKPVTVLSKQNITFTANDTAACKAPFIVNFTSNLPGATGLTWDFGDGSTSTNANPTHTYNSSGNFDVTLIAKNESGCQDTLTKPGYIKIQPPSVTLPGLPVKNCVPFTYAFSAEINSLDPVTRYNWNFGDGTTDSVANPSHTFNAVGSYTISLTITTISGCTATTRVVKGVNAGNKPVANFTATPLVACVGVPITFTDLSSGNVNEWLWKFGDKTTSTLKNPTHTYKGTGYFTVTLIARSNGCPDSITFSKYIYINPPVAKFSIKGNCALPYEKIFTETSKGANTFLWNFGDGITSASKNPTHVYADTGVYPVTLTVTNLSTGCQDTLTRNAQVVIEKAMFVANTTSICKNTVVTFRSQNINLSKVSTYNWDFGDGSVAATSVDTVVHKYTSTGAFNVRLIITNVLNCKDTLIKPGYINVYGPVANFSTSQTSCLSTNINFIDSSISDGTNAIVKWVWDYGDNKTETLTAPPFNHAYSKTGTYTIKLKVTDNSGCMDSLTRTNYLLISKPAADFASQDTGSCPNASIKFNSTSQGNELIYLWNFGDGTTSDSINPVHQYAYTDTFTVSLKIIDKYGCTDSVEKANYIAVTYPKADFTLSDSVGTCPPFAVQFNNSSLNYTSFLWDFGDGSFSTSLTPTRTYLLPGRYVVKLRATGRGGCFDEKFVTIVVKGPTGILSYTNTIGCNSVVTNFKAATTNNISFTWDFNDGTTVKTSDSLISHTYTDTGFYLPKLILEGANGCRVPISGIDTIKTIGLKANFYSMSKTTCDAGVISFSDSTFGNDVISNWQWDFGDASSSSQQNPAHYYASPGLYTVSMIATTANGCRDTVTKVAYSKVVARPDIGIQGNTAGCKLDTLTFKGIFIKPDTSAVIWQWDFANGQTATLQDPSSQIYYSAGNYIVSAIAANSSGCKDTASQTVLINPLPNTNAGNDAFLCLGSAAQLQASGAFTYQWLPPTNFLSCLNCSNPVTSTPVDITYLVKGTDGIGCSAIDSVSIKVKKPFSISIIPGADSVCIGDGVQLNASNAENYLWSPAATLNNAFIRNPVASPGSNTIYKVLAYDSGSCFKDSAFVSITAFNYPTVDAGPDKTIKAGASVLISPVYSNDVINWLWTPAEGLNCDDCPSPIAKPKITATYTIEVLNNGGCSATDKVTIFATCNSENIFIPNTFSPNGDGVNEVFYPRGTGINKIRGMKIFNRWGEIVFERSNFYANDPTSGWNGLVGGKKVPSDVYTFIIELICDNNDLVSQSGNVTLLR